MQTWTFREGKFTEKDKVAIRGMAEISPEAAQILMTGAISLNRLNSRAIDMLSYVNTTVNWPIVGRNDRILYMLRFDPEQIWPVLPDGTLQRLIDREAARFGVDKMCLSRLDFYESLFEHMCLEDTFTTDIYLNALTLFHKPLNPSIPASHFLSANIDLVAGRKSATEKMLVQRNKVWDKSSRFITPGEAQFLIEIVT